MKNQKSNQEKSLVVLPREQALKSLVKSGVESSMGRILDYLEDMDRAVNFMINWQMGTVLGLNPTQRIDRWATTLRLSERAGRDADFHHELLKNPRYLTAIAAHESCGLKPIDFLWQVNTVSVIEEEPGLHWLILPACHLGCGTPEGKELPSTIGSCSVCGKPIGQMGDCQQEISSLATPAERIHAIDEFIVRTVGADVSSHARLLADPTSFFVQASQTLFGVLPHEEFGIQEVKVVADTDTALYLVLLAKHESKSSVTANNQNLRTENKKN